MSGVEVAGLTLAIFPLVLKGLGGFVEGVDQVKRWRSYRRELANYTREISTQRVVYLATLEQLLDGIILSDTAFASMLLDPKGPQWKDPEYEQRLKIRLAYLYQPYIDTTKFLVESLEQLRDKLGIGSTGEIKWESHPWLKREAKRAEVIFSKNVYNELIENIRRANQDLFQMTNQSRDLELGRKQRQWSRRSKAPNFQRIRQHARSLYKVVVAGDCWNCKHCWHTANLRLEPRSNDSTTLTFKVTFSAHLDTGALAIETAATTPSLSEFRWKWQEVEIRSLVTAAAAPTAAGDSPNQADKLPEPGRKKEVKWKLDSASTQTDSSNQHYTPNGSPILNLCEALHQQAKSSNQRKASLGFLSNEQHRHDIYLLGEQLSDMATMPLLSVLSETLPTSKSWKIPGHVLSRRDRLQIAATLASSVLQLDGTDWARHQWRATDIFLISREGSKHAPLDLYITSKVPSKRCQESNQTKPITEHLIRDEALVSLGLTLLELSFQRPLEQLRAPEDEDTAETRKDWNTAKRLLKYVADENGEEYKNVVRRCLDCHFDVDEDDATFENARFQQEVFETVVAPLNRLLEAFDGNLDALSYKQR